MNEHTHIYLFCIKLHCFYILLAQLCVFCFAPQTRGISHTALIETRNTVTPLAKTTESRLFFRSARYMYAKCSKPWLSQYSLSGSSSTLSAESGSGGKTHLHQQVIQPRGLIETAVHKDMYVGIIYRELMLLFLKGVRALFRLEPFGECRHEVCRGYGACATVFFSACPDTRFVLVHACTVTSVIENGADLGQQARIHMIKSEAASC